MTKFIEITETPTSFLIPLSAITAPMHAVSKDPTRYYLGGVFIEREENGTVNAIATDGHILLKKEITEGAFVGDSVQTEHGASDRGFILKCDVKDKAFKMKKNTWNVWVYGDTETGLLQMIDKGCTDGNLYLRTGVCEFEVVDGTFPNYRGVIPNHNTGAERFTFDPSNLLKLQQGGHECIKNMPTSSGVNHLCPVSMSSGEDNDPILVKFEQGLSLIGVLMPINAKKCNF